MTDKKPQRSTVVLCRPTVLLLLLLSWD